MSYQWLLFDADGTLFDYEAAEEKAFMKSFEAAGIEFLPKYLEVYAEVNSSLWHLFEQQRIGLKELRVTRFSQLFERLGIHANAEKFSQPCLNWFGCI